jgi:hypothetical protein
MSRKKVLTAFAAAGLAALLAGMGACHSSPRHEDDSAAGRQPRGIDRSEDLGAEQRRIAADACKLHDWNVCERSLDRAAVFDPEGDRAAEVTALRVAIAAGQERAASAVDAAAR